MSAFDELLPELILDAARLLGAQADGALTPLNSYENRVYEVAMSDGPPVIAKFYRPGRWHLQALCDEHRFVLALAEAELPVVAPFQLRHPVAEQATLGKIGKYFCAFYPKFRGRQTAELTDDDRKLLGHVLGRLHNIGAQMPLKHRIVLDPETYGYASLDYILSQNIVPERLRESLTQTLIHAVRLCEPFFDGSFAPIAVHGDCHWGNILWATNGPHLVDFDDCLLAPAVQDVWMLFNGTPAEVHEQREAFLEGYETFREFDHASFILSEPLRTLRMVHHAAWVGRRYDEAAFQRAFPYYRDERYWEQLLLGLKEQVSLLQDLNSC